MFKQFKIRMNSSFIHESMNFIYLRSIFALVGYTAHIPLLRKVEAKKAAMVEKYLSRICSLIMLYYYTSTK